MRRWFHGVREHLVFTPLGMIRTIVQMPARRHDVQGLYQLLSSNLKGLLLGDNAYSPNPRMAQQLREIGVEVLASKRRNAAHPHPETIRKLLHEWRRRIERQIALFNAQFHASNTVNRSARHYIARRWFKATAHNISRLLNLHSDLNRESVAHFRLAA